MSDPPSAAEPAHPRRRWFTFRRKPRPLWIRVLSYCLAVPCVGMLVFPAIQGHRLRSRVAALERNGETLVLAELAPAHIPPEDNAAILLAFAFAELDEVDRRARGVATEQAKRTGKPVDPQYDAHVAFRKSLTFACFREHEAHLRARLTDHQEALRLAEAALTRPACRFEVEYEAGMDADLPHLARLSTLAGLFALRAIAQSADGQVADPETNVVQILRLARTLEGEPIFVSEIVRLRIDRIATRTLQELVDHHALSSAALAQLVPLLADETNQLTAVHTLKGERASAYTYFHGGLEEKLMSPLPRALLRQSLIVYLDAMEDIIASADLSYFASLQTCREMDASVPGLRDSASWAETARHHLPSYLAAGAKTQARLRSAAVGCSLAADMADGAAPPETLEGVPVPLRTDPFTGTDLRVTRTEDALVVYSVGMNGQDDGGVFEKHNPNRSPDIKDDIAFRVPLRTVSGHSL